MGFTSGIFLLSCLVVLLLYYLIPGRFRWVLLLAASYGFCLSQNPESLAVLISISLVNYFLGLNMKDKKALFIFSVALNLVFLFGFKYLLFPAQSLNFFVASQWNFKLLALVGLSYYILQCISYQNDVYLNIIPPEKHLGKFSLYLAFFPKLLAGPIESPESFLKQLQKPLKALPLQIGLGSQRIIIGLFKKMVLAEGLQPIVNQILENETATGLDRLFGVYLYTLQLYFDLSGYTDIAIGIALLFGFKLTENFKLPFTAKSITDFWRKWHISLIKWLTDYLYYPIVYSLRSWKEWATLIGIFITFLLSGIWHGISLNFFIWGGLHASYMIWEASSQNFRKKLKIPSLLAVFLTFNIVALTNLFIRYVDYEQAFQTIKSLFVSNKTSELNFINRIIFDLKAVSYSDVAFNKYCILALVIVFLISEAYTLKKTEEKKILWPYLFLLCLGIFFFASFINAQQFIYVWF